MNDPQAAQGTSASAPTDSPEASVPVTDQPSVDETFADYALKEMSAGLLVGEAMLHSRVATSEVDSAVRRLNNAFGLPQVEVSVTMNEIFLGLVDPRLPWPMTMVRVVDIGEARLDLLVRYEDLIGRVESGDLDLEATQRELEHVARSRPARPWWVSSLFYLLSVAAWVLFAGGGVVGALAGVAGAAVTQVVVVPLARARLPEAFGTAASASMAVAGPAAAAYAGLPINLTPAMVGGLYPLVPGGALVSSVIDGLSGSPLSSIAKGLQVAVSGIALALGALGALVVVSDLEITDTALAPQTPALLVGLSAAVAVAAIALARHVPVRLVPGTAILGFASWSVMYFMPQGADGFPTSSFVGAVVIGAGGQLISRLRHTSASVYTTTSVFVLVPGFTIYLSMVAFAQGDSNTGMQLLIRSLTIAGAIAAGVTLGVALTRTLPLPRARMGTWRRHSLSH